MAAVKPHWLPGAARTWSPDSIVCFDTETHERLEGTDKVLTPRCWTAVWTLRHDVAPTLARRVVRSGVHMRDLAHFVVEAAGAVTETWVFAHNLGFDLSVSALPFQLDMLGWDLDGCSLTSESTWWVFKSDKRRLVLTDSWSWLRCSLSDVSKDIRRRKVPLPKGDATLNDWLKRCRKDSLILAEAVLALLDWWDGSDLGRFGITGAGCG